MASASLDCESQLAAVRARLLYLRDALSDQNKNNLLTPSSPEIKTREKTRMKGFASTQEGDKSFVGGARQKRLRRASITGQEDGLRDRIIRTFNLNEKKGLEALRENGYCRTPEQTARFFLNTPGLKKEMIGKALGAMTDERGLESLRIFAEGVGMEGLPFVRSLRKFLAKFKLPGEAQMVDRILNAFAQAFFKQNPDEFTSPTAAHGLAFRLVDFFGTSIASRTTWLCLPLRLSPAKLFFTYSACFHAA